MKLSIIVVPYKCKDKLEITLDAVFASTASFPFEVIVLDNDSGDGTEELVLQKYAKQIEDQQLRFVQNGRNLGFPKANNIGMKLASGEYLLLLNPDTQLDPDNLSVMMRFMQSRPDVGIATCKLVKPDGSLDAACRRNEPDPKVAFYRLSGLQFLWPKKFGAYNIAGSDIDQEGAIDACVGAYMFMSRQCYELTNGFDERFYMYGEDLDLCRRAREAGLKVWYYPKTSCLHFKGQSSKKSPKKSLYAFHEAMWLYYDKWYRRHYGWPMSVFVYLGVWGRYYLKLVQNWFRQEAIVSR